MSQHEDLITTLNELYFVVESDLQTLSGVDANEIDVDDVYVETTKEKFEEFVEEIRKLLEQEYPDYEVTFYTSEEDNDKVIIGGYKIKYVGKETEEE